MNGALDGIRVIDLSRVLAGPWAGQMLADFGADVIKIEKPGVGDDTRHWGPPWLRDEQGNEMQDAAYFFAGNRNKRSVTCNLAHPDGAQIVRDLVKSSDVLLENYRVGALARFGLDADRLQDINPSLIYCSVTAYGQDAARRDEPGYDAMIQASAGLMSVTGEAESEGGQPQKVGVAVADIMAGMYAGAAILAAINERHNSGRGQRIDVPLFDSQVALLANQAMNYLIGESVPGRFGTAHPNIVPYQAFKTRDGALMVAVGNEKQFAAFAGGIGQPGLAADPRFVSNSERVRNREVLVRLISERLLEDDSAHWLTVFSQCNVPAGPINDLAAVFADAHVREQQLVRELPHPQAGTVPSVANPVKLSATPVQYRYAPPMLGEHTDEILAQVLGYSPEKIAALADAGAI